MPAAFFEEARDEDAPVMEFRSSPSIALRMDALKAEEAAAADKQALMDSHDAAVDNVEEGAEKMGSKDSFETPNQEVEQDIEKTNEDLSGDADDANANDASREKKKKKKKLAHAGVSFDDGIMLADVA